MSIVSELIEASHELASLGLSPGMTGNVSYRDGETIYVSRSGVSLRHIAEEDFLAISEEYEIFKPTKEVPLHSELYRRNPYIQVIIHLHSPLASAYACVKPWSAYSAIPPVSPYFVMKVGNCPMVDYARPGSVELGENMARLEADFENALLQNHGQITSGTTVDQAFQRAIEVESASQLALTLGKLDYRELTDDECLDLAQRNGQIWNTSDFR